VQLLAQAHLAHEIETHTLLSEQDCFFTHEEQSVDVYLIDQGIHHPPTHSTNGVTQAGSFH